MRSLLVAAGVLLFALPARADDAGADAASDASDAASDALPDPMPTPSVTAKQCTKLDWQCERAEFTVSKSEKIAGDFDFDTGWLPKDSAIQVRLYSYLHGRTRVDMSGRLDATWPDPIRLRPDGKAGSGLLAIDDGVVAKAQIRFKVNVGGKDYSWEGDIPGAPSVDFASLSSVTFDPWAWKGGLMPPTTGGKTKELDLYKVPLTDSFIPIPGIEGGFELRGQGEFGASYVSVRIAFDEMVAKGSIADVDPTHPFTQLLFSSSPAFDTSLFVHGELTRKFTIHFIPALYFTIVGKTFALDLLDVPLPLPETTKPWDFDPVAVHVPLPQILVKPNPIDLGEIPIGKSTAILATLFDTGEASLVVDATSAHEALTVDTKHLELVGGTTDSLRAALTPTTEGPIEAQILLVSNDPSVPKLPLKIKANAVAGAPAGDDAGTESAGSCGCRTTPSTSAPWGGVAIALVALSRRRRRSA